MIVKALLYSSLMSGLGCINDSFKRSFRLADKCTYFFSFSKNVHILFISSTSIHYALIFGHSIIFTHNKKTTVLNDRFR